MTFINTLSILLFLIFLLLGFLHFYWAFGGKWGLDAAIPTKVGGKRSLNPRPLDTIIVGLGLCLFGAFYLLQTTWLDIILPDRLLKILSWIIPIIFLLRAIGDFKYAGFFKKIKGTNFSKWDTRLFSPLCLFLGFSGVIIALFNFN